MVAQNNIDVHHKYTLCQLCPNVTPGHGKEVVDGFNTIDNRYIYQLMSNIQLPG